tara:strand:- start:290 stop:532 length:243 start_codon:yes stop_codon:yes gene_type:complete
MSPIKWFAAVLGLAVGVTHIGMIGMVSRRNNDKLPDLDIPVGPYTSYVVQADKEGYKISYKANDPKTHTSLRTSKRKVVS